MDDEQDTRAQPLARTRALVRFDAGWQRLESFLCAAVLAAEIGSLTLWVILKGLSAGLTTLDEAAAVVAFYVVVVEFFIYRDLS